MTLMQEMNQKALELGVPLSAHIDLTFRCNERCIHCYLDHEDYGEMTTAEIEDVLDQLAEAGTFFPGRYSCARISLRSSNTPGRCSSA